MEGQQNTQVFAVERWCWWTYLRSSDGDADMEHRLVDTVGEGGRETIQRRAGNIHVATWRIDSQ